MIDKDHGWNVSLKAPIQGFILLLILSVSAFRLVTRHHLTDMTLDYALLGLAALQMLLQLVFFFHLGLRSKPHWYLITFLFTLLVIVIVVGGSLWIMNNLDYNTMPNMGH